MRDRGLILGGLAVFLALVTLPFWYNLAARTPSRAPELKLPAGEKQCVAPVETMREKHMEILIAWRDQVVRRHDRDFTSPDGRHFDVSLTRTCLKCHDDKAAFCDKCHDYAGVKPVCWDCHVVPQPPQRSEG